jgi:hypothetical protein
MKTFSLNRSNGVEINPSFYIDFKNVYLTFVKTAPKKVLLKNRFFWDLTNFSIGKTFFFPKTFLSALFYKFTFLKSVRKDGFFDTPFAIFEEKSFHLKEH